MISRFHSDANLLFICGFLLPLPYPAKKEEIGNYRSCRDVTVVNLGVDSLAVAIDAGASDYLHLN